jgi:sodium transport system permease protein
MHLDARRVRVIFAKELRETLRDRRTVFAALVFPMILYPLMMLGLAQASAMLTRDIHKREVHVAIANPAAAPGFEDRLRQVEGVEVLQVERATPDLLASKTVDAAIEFAPDAAAEGPTTAEIRFNGADEMSREARDRVERVLAEYRDDLVKARLQARNVDPSILEPFDVKRSDSASAAARGGFVLGRVAALLLVTMSLFGAFYPALDLAAGEKERGTIETLLVSPASRAEIVAGKYLAIVAIALVTALMNLASLSLTFSRMAASLGKGASSDFAFSITAEQAAVVLLALVPFAALTSALALAVSTLARSYKEGQNYLTPLVVFVIVPANLAILPGVRLEPTTALVPVLNVTLLVREALLGPVEFLPLILTIASTAVFAVAALAFARSLFDSEAVLLRDSGDVDWRFWRRAPRAPASLEPWHGLLTFLVVLVLLYYVGSGAQERDLRWGLVVTEVLIVLAISLVAIRLTGVGLAEGLGLRAPTKGSVLGALVIGLGAAVAALPVTTWINELLPPPPEFEDAMRTIAKQLEPDSPWDFVLVLALVSVLPAVCEEALHRGLLMRSFLRRWGPAAAITVSGLLFGVFHLSPYRFVWTGLLGLLLGWLAWRSRSIVTSVVAHATVNGSAILLEYSPRLQAILGLDADSIGAGTLAIQAATGGLLVAGGVVLVAWPSRRAA